MREEQNNCQIGTLVSYVQGDAHKRFIRSDEEYGYCSLLCICSVYNCVYIHIINTHTRKSEHVKSQCIKCLYNAQAFDGARLHCSIYYPYHQRNTSIEPLKWICDKMVSLLCMCACADYNTGKTVQTLRMLTEINRIDPTNIHVLFMFHH